MYITTHMLRKISATRIRGENQKFNGINDIDQQERSRKVMPLRNSALNFRSNVFFHGHNPPISEVLRPWIQNPTTTNTFVFKGCEYLQTLFFLNLKRTRWLNNQHVERYVKVIVRSNVSHPNNIRNITSKDVQVINHTKDYKSLSSLNKAIPDNATGNYIPTLPIQLPKKGKFLVLFILTNVKSAAHFSAAIVYHNLAKKMEYYILEPHGQIYFYEKLAEILFETHARDIFEDRMYLSQRVQNKNSICILHTMALLKEFLEMVNKGLNIKTHFIKKNQIRNGNSVKSTRSSPVVTEQFVQQSKKSYVPTRVKISPSPRNLLLNNTKNVLNKMFEKQKSVKTNQIVLDIIKLFPMISEQLRQSILVYIFSHYHGNSRRFRNLPESTMNKLRRTMNKHLNSLSKEQLGEIVRAVGNVRSVNTLSNEQVGEMIVRM